MLRFPFLLVLFTGAFLALSPLLAQEEMVPDLSGSGVEEKAIDVEPVDEEEKKDGGIITQEQENESEAEKPTPAETETEEEKRRSLIEKARNSIKDEEFKTIVVLRALNKITARTSLLEVPVAGKTQFGTLEIVLQACWKAPPEQMPENKALLRIWEKIPSEDKKELFYGWMFSSSPALSALEHPVYDLTVVECRN